MEVFGLAFLDCICCGFGAVILLYVMTTREDGLTIRGAVSEARAETSRIAERLEDGQRMLAQLRNSLEDERRLLADLATEERQLRSLLDRDRAELSNQQTVSQAEIENLNALKSDQEAVKEQISQLAQSQNQTDGGNINARQGTERRHYVTGLRVDGQRAVILLDCSGSTVADDLATYRQFYAQQPLSDRLRAPKRVRMLDALDWLIATSESTQIQVILYNDQARFALPGSAGQWIERQDRQSIEALSELAWQHLPQGGADLAAAVALAKTLSPRPDNVYLLTDALPTRTHGSGPTSPAAPNPAPFVAAFQLLAQERQSLHVILFPFTDDPLATPTYWNATARLNGSFFAPAPDWPN